MTTYDVEVSRDGRWWHVVVPGIGGVTQARRFADVEPMARELIQVTTGCAEVDLRLGRVTIGSIAVSDRLDRIREERAVAARLERQATDGARALAREIASQGVPLRELGALLGISHQRAHQLVSQR